MNKTLIGLLLALLTWTAEAIDQQWRYDWLSDSYCKITRTTGSWSEANSEAKSWHATLYTGDCDFWLGSWLKNPSLNGLNWIFHAEGKYDARGKRIAYGSIGVSKTGLISHAYPTSGIGGRYGIMQFHVEYLPTGEFGDWVWDDVLGCVWDPTAPVYYATSPWDYYPGPIGGGLD